MQRLTIGRFATTATLMTLAACGASTAAVSTSGATPAALTTPTPPSHSPAAPVATVAPRAATPAAPQTVAVVVVRPASTAMGEVLVAAANGRTVYTFDADSAGRGRTNCNAGCVSEWPPLTVVKGTKPLAVSGLSGRLGTIMRQDGRTQVTDNGLALYFFAGDTGPAQTHGSYPGWSVAKP